MRFNKNEAFLAPMISGKGRNMKPHARKMKFAISVGRRLPAASWLVARALRSRRAAMRLKAVQALRSVSGRMTFAALVLTLEDKSRDVRLAAAQALGNIGDPAALPRLACKAVNDSEGDVRSESILAIGRIAHPDSAKCLVDIIRRRKNIETGMEALSTLLGEAGHLMSAEDLNAVLSFDKRSLLRSKKAIENPARLKNTLFYAKFLADFELERRKGNVRTGSSGQAAGQLIA